MFLQVEFLTGPLDTQGYTDLWQKQMKSWDIVVLLLIIYFLPENIGR